MSNTKSKEDYIRANAFKLTDDDWYSNEKLASTCEKYQHKNKLVEVSCLSLPPAKDNDTTRVCVWGNDDFGLEKDFDNRIDAMTCYIEILSQKVVNKKWLKSIGFVNA